MKVIADKATEHAGKYMCELVHRACGSSASMCGYIQDTHFCHVTGGFTFPATDDVVAPDLVSRKHGHLKNKTGFGSLLCDIHVSLFPTRLQIIPFQSEIHEEVHWVLPEVISSWRGGT